MKLLITSLAPLDFLCQALDRIGLGQEISQDPLSHESQSSQLRIFIPHFALLRERGNMFTPSISGTWSFSEPILEIDNL